MRGFEQSVVWATFSAKATDEERVFVRRLLDYAEPILDRVIETFPTYTLHNHVHAENVVRLIGELLGPAVGNITALEGALLLLSAYFHDIGMVFDENELVNLREDLEFPAFLKRHPAAHVQLARQGELSRDLAEWYCRWRHADRVYVQLDALPAEALRWGVVSLRDAVGELCRSHNESTDFLKDDHLFPIDFLGDCDLRFCGLLLRLADILDFDRSRSPDAIYHRLGLPNRATPRMEQSDVEWRKHIASAGFKFPDDPAKGYALKLVAGPDEPAVEHDLREFLDTIDSELRQASVLIRSCSNRWRDLPLPERIDRSDIRSNGYRYGDYQFLLDRDQVLQLFMGENLYQDPHAFVRELAQNAIDTCRHRTFFEHSRGNVNYSSPAIRVRHWTDQDNRLWVRFDDDGMGMDDELILEYFLKVGRSYYRSARFEADQLEYQGKTKQHFQPISRFGIGVLSCFIMADRVEVTTRRANVGDHLGKGIRLSLPGLEGFYTLQEEPMAAARMPSPVGDEPGYRVAPGTSVAVRIDPRREHGTFDVESALRRYVICPPVPIEVEGVPVCGAPGLLTDQPWLTRQSLDLGAKETAAIARVLDTELTENLRLTALPINLTAASPLPELKGQFVVFVVEGGDELKDALRIPAYERAYLSTSVESGVLKVECTREVNAQRLQYFADRLRTRLEAGSVADEHEQALMRSELKKIEGLQRLAPMRRESEATVDLESFASADLPKWQAVLQVLGDTDSFISHNGVAVPCQYISEFGQHQLDLPEFRTPETASCAVLGFIGLADRLRPELTVSRDLLRDLPWVVQSACTLAFRRAAVNAGVDHWSDAELFHLVPSGPTSLGSLVVDPLLLSADAWLAERIISIPGGMISLLEIREAANGGKTVYLTNLPNPYSLVDTDTFGESVDFLDLCAAAIVQLCLTVCWVGPGPSRGWSCIVDASEPSAMPEGLSLFPPLFFINYDESSALKAGKLALNRRHPFSEWLIDSAPTLSTGMPGMFTLLRDEVANGPLYTPPARVVQKVNVALARVAALDSSIRPPKSAYLSIEDFVD